MTFAYPEILCYPHSMVEFSKDKLMDLSISRSLEEAEMLFRETLKLWQPSRGCELWSVLRAGQEIPANDEHDYLWERVEVLFSACASRHIEVAKYVFVVRFHMSRTTGDGGRSGAV